MTDIPTELREMANNHRRVNLLRDAGILRGFADQIEAMQDYIQNWEAHSIHCAARSTITAEMGPCECGKTKLRTMILEGLK